MTVRTDITNLKINKLTKEQYESIENPSDTELYFVVDDGGISSSEIETALGYVPADASVSVTHTDNTAVGSATNPVYIDSDGSAIAVTYSLNKTVPADAVFTDTTYSTFVGADGTNAGTSGLVPAPISTDNDKFLKGDGTWAEVSSGSSSLSGLTDVNITSVNDGQVLTYDSNESKWINSSSGGGLSYAMVVVDHRE